MSKQAEAQQCAPFLRSKFDPARNIWTIGAAQIRFFPIANRIVANVQFGNKGISARAKNEARAARLLSIHVAGLDAYVAALRNEGIVQAKRERGAAIRNAARLTA